MLLDLLAYAFTPCSRAAREFGFLKSSLQVQARYRRCRRAWEPHLAATRRVILDAAAGCAQRRTAVLFGAGLLHDIPLRALAERFERVALVDVVFPWASRVAAARWRHVELCADDVTATLGDFARAVRDRTAPLPTSQPTRFLEEPQVDLVVSVNLLSQLPFAQRMRLARAGRSDAALDAYARHLYAAHLAYLRNVPGRVALITDVHSEQRDRAGRVVEEWDTLPGIELPPPGETWEWKIAPAPEADAQLDRVLRVAAYPDWKAATSPRAR